MRSQKKHGAVLIMTMMALCLVFMMVHALMQSTGIGLTNSASFYDREAALEAAKSGVDFAVTRLRSNFGWRGDANCAYMNSSYQDIRTQGSVGSGFIVSETNGNVVGLLLNRNKNRSAFRIKFSYQDNSADTYDRAVKSRFGLVGTSEMLPKLPIKLPFVSINNLAGTSAVLAYRAQNDGVGINDNVTNLEYGSDEDEQMRSFAYHVPPQRICLIVEGLAGKGLRDCNNPEEVNKVANEGGWSKPVTRRYVETYLTTVAPVVNGDAAYASQDINFDIKKKLLVSTHMRNFTSDVSQQDDKTTVPVAGSMRSDKSDISVLNGKLNTFNGKLICNNARFSPDTSKYHFLDAEGKKQVYTFGETTKVANDGSIVEGIDWEDVAKAENTTANAIVPGFYQWHLAPDSTKDKPYYQLRYYKDGCTIEDKGTPVPVRADSYQIAVCGAVDSADSTVEIDGRVIQKMSMGPSDKLYFVTDADGHITEPTLAMAGNLYCDGDFTIGSDVTEVKDFCPKVIVNSCIKSVAGSGEDGEAVVESEAGNLTVDGDIYIASSLFGSGAMVTNTGDITFIGSSVLESGNGGVALYGNNVTLKSLEGVMAKAPGKGAGKGKDLDGNLAGGDESADVNEDGSKNFLPEVSFYDVMKDEWEKSSSDILSRSNDEQTVVDYFAKQGVNVCCAATGYSIEYYDFFGHTKLTSARFSARVYFADENGKPLDDASYFVYFTPDEVLVRKVVGEVDPHIITFSYLDGNVPGVTITSEANILVPKEYVITHDGELPENLQSYVDKFDTVCYGDQNFTGVIYAKNNFVADLDKKYNLTVNGAIRAQNGKIDVKCNSAELSYDESYLTKLLPGFNKLTCKMWNCW